MQTDSVREVYKAFDRKRRELRTLRENKKPLKQREEAWQEMMRLLNLLPPNAQDSLLRPLAKKHPSKRYDAPATRSVIRI